MLLDLLLLDEDDLVCQPQFMLRYVWVLFRTYNLIMSPNVATGGKNIAIGQL